MSHRDPHVWLDSAEARCEPSALPQCGRFTCGRYKAAVASGSPLEDFNRERTPISPPCPRWISAEMKAPQKSTARPVFRSLSGREP